MMVVGADPNVWPWVLKRTGALATLMGAGTRTMIRL
jgi:hypothetical protein